MEIITSEKCVDLAYDVYDGTDEEMMVVYLSPVVIFHGLLDNKENWMDLAKSIADKLVRKVCVLDMRNHGDSPKTANISHQLNVNDLEKFLKKINEPVILIGHSFGGMTAIDIAFNKPYLLKGLILIDVSPLRYPENEEMHGLYNTYQIRSLINELNSKREYKSKVVREDLIYKHIKYHPFRKLILSNLVEDGEGFKMKFNLDTVAIDLGEKKKMEEIYPLQGCYLGKTLLIHGSSSEYVLASDYEDLKKSFPNLNISCINDCGHWIHMEKTDELNEIILQFISKCIR